MELDRFSWDAFAKTGDIDAYLLYKTVSDIEKQEEDEWLKLEQEVLS